MSNTALLNEITVPLSDRQRSLIADLDKYDFTPVVKKTAYETRMKEADLWKHVPELKKLYALRIIDEKQTVGIPVNLDPLVHTHVLFTREYRAFCDKYFGAFYDHFPCTPDDASHMAWLGKVYSATVERYDSTFTARQKESWPDPTSNSLSEVCCGCCGGG